ncbi:MAG: hypothetical protein RL404_274 [Pseudomonadota bacterium]|jgi:uncharacterized protein YdiU (UPF0061 family)
MNSPNGLPAAFTPSLRRLNELSLANSFASLPPAFYTRLQSTPLPSPYLVCASADAAKLAGLDPASFDDPQFVEIFSGNAQMPASLPLSAVYSGHQFGVWAGQLGDGRAILLGEVPATAPAEAVGAPGDPSGVIELQLKGAGKTPYSRMGDGRAVLRSSIREFLCSEAMAGLGIPTTRALCVIGSDLRVMRELPESTAVVTRMAPSFVRFGSFEHWFYNDRKTELMTLADFIIARHYPWLQDEANRYQALLREVTRRSAELVAQWQSVGFMHGVLNTDNMSILGQTLDYGPYGFMEAYDPAHICNHTDAQGRYSYRMQPRIVEWNCYALGQALLPLVGDVDDVYEALAVFKTTHIDKMAALWRAKLGLATHQDSDTALVEQLLNIMAAGRVDFPVFFRQLSQMTIGGERDPAIPGTGGARGDEALRDLFIDRAAFDAWSVEYRQRLRAEGSVDVERRQAMNRVNPKYVLRNYLAQVAIDKAQQKDFSEVQRLLHVLQRPFDEQPDNENYAALPPDWAAGIEVSCSS